ncbi:MAG TPA: heme NO-binding domain-containing protein [Methylomirabilota bacterium]|nr:heme NO-binding domain-containing protein [Methylomirabilota bacterium]
MHGFIFNEIRKYVVAKLGAPAWDALLDGAGLPGKTFVNYESYPDEAAVGLVVTASKVTGLAVDVILEDFGGFLAADLATIYKPLIDPSWKVLDFVEHTEETIHHVVRSRNTHAHPPRISCNRVGPNEVVIVYSSPRKLCALAKGIARGAAQLYGEEVSIREVTCMHRGNPECLIVVQKEDASIAS